MGGTMSRLWVAVAVLAGLVCFVSGCAMNPTAAPSRRSGPLEVRLSKAGAPGGANPAPPAGFDLFRCGVDVLNTSDSRIDLDYKDGELVLYQGKTPIDGQYEGTSSTGVTAAGELMDSSSTILPGKARLAVSRTFLIKPDQRNLTLVYRLPGRGEFTWRVR
jgi:hypothetical protein